MVRLQDLKVEEFRHPLDSEAFDKMTKNKRVLDKVFEYVSNMMERIVSVNYMGTCYSINNNSLPELYDEFVDVAKTLDINDLPDLYVQWGFDLHTSTDGDSHPVMIINSGVIDLLEPEERKFYFGHEFGHIAANHLRYLLLCRYWYFADRFVPGASYLTGPMMYWSRMTDFTADRMGLLACQDIEVALRTMTKHAGVPMKYYNDIKTAALNTQVEEFNKIKESQMSEIIEKALVFSRGMPWIINRASLLIDWYKNGNYNEIIQRYGR